MPRKPNATNQDADLTAAQLFDKSGTQLAAILAQLKALAVSDKRPDPAWEAGNDPDASAPMIDTDPATDALGQARATARVLRRVAKAEARKYSGRAVKATGADDIAAALSSARRTMAKAYAELLEAQRLLAEEQAQAEADRKAYATRNAGKLAAKRKEMEAKQRRLQRELASMSQAS